MHVCVCACVLVHAYLRVYVCLLLASKPRVWLKNASVYLCLLFIFAPCNSRSARDSKINLRTRESKIIADRKVLGYGSTDRLDSIHIVVVFFTLHFCLITKSISTVEKTRGESRLSYLPEAPPLSIVARLSC